MNSTPEAISDKWREKFKRKWKASKRINLSWFEKQQLLKDIENINKDSDRNWNLDNVILKNAAKDWWENKGSIPVLEISKKYAVDNSALSLFIRAQIFEKASMGNLQEENSSLYSAYYFAAKGQESKQHFF